MMGDRLPQVGQVVTSRAGRDRGRAYLVVGITPDGRVLVADGERRRVATPKAKNPLHLWFHDRVDEAVARCMREGKAVTDGQVRASLQELWPKQDSALA